MMDGDGLDFGVVAFFVIFITVVNLYTCVRLEVREYIPLLECKMSLRVESHQSMAECVARDAIGP